MKLNSLSQEVLKIISEKLPTGDSAQDKERIQAYWPQFDKNKNGYLSLAQINSGVRYVFRLPDVFPLEPVAKRAFNASKAKLPAMTKYGNQYVSVKEFPYLIKYIRDYYRYWAVFNEIDKNHDKQLSLQEFNAAVPLLESLKIPVPNAKQLFSKLDKDKGGSIDFNQFVYWILLNRFKFDI